MLESVVEKRLKVLESYGFAVLKLRTPGVNGVPDRMILWPMWSGHPSTVFVECKAPKKDARLLQEAIHKEWRLRGADVREVVDTPEKADKLVQRLLVEAVMRVPLFKREALPVHIRRDYQAAAEAYW